jgi:hypothetical protein
MIEIIRRKVLKRGLFFGGGLILVLFVLIWGNIQYARENPGGQDFLVHWMSTRLFLTQGIDPYSDEAAEQIQDFAEKHLMLDEGSTNYELSELRLVSPLYSIILFLPFLFSSDFALSRALWMTILEAALIVQAVLFIQLVSWRPRWPTIAGLLLFSIVWYPAAQSIVDGDMVILIGLFIAGSLLAMRNKHDEIAGVLFAFSTIKINISLLLIIFVLIWTYRQGRWRLIGWFSGTLLLLGLGIALLMPDWIISNLGSVVAFVNQNSLILIGEVLSGELPAAGKRIGWILSIVAIIILLIEWWLARRKEFRLFLWTAFLTLVISQWVGVRINVGNFVLLFPVIALIFTLLFERWQRGGRIIGGIVLAFLAAGIWLLYLDRAGQIAQSSLLIFPIPIFLMIMLYWVRWWIVRSYDLGFESTYNDVDTDFI